MSWGVDNGVAMMEVMRMERHKEDSIISGRGGSGEDPKSCAIHLGRRDCSLLVQGI